MHKLTSFSASHLSYFIQTSFESESLSMTMKKACIPPIKKNDKNDENLPITVQYNKYHSSLTFLKELRTTRYKHFSDETTLQTTIFKMHILEEEA